MKQPVADKKAAMEEAGLVVSDESTIYYDDVVIATKRIGCKVEPSLSVIRQRQ